MNLQDQVISLSLAKRLKELGMKQESLVCWVRGRMDYGYEGEWAVMESDEHFLFTENLGSRPEATDFTVDFGGYDEAGKWIDKEARLRKQRAKEVYSAYTVAELGEMLPKNIEWHSETGFTGGAWSCTSTNPTGFKRTFGETEAEARGLLLAYLLENNLITL